MRIGINRTPSRATPKEKWLFINPVQHANIAKENGYAILTPPAGDANIAKENGYAILTPPAGDVTIAKMNAYVILIKLYPSVQIIE